MIILVWTLYALLVALFATLVITTRPLKREQKKIRSQSYKGYNERRRPRSCNEAYRTLYSNLGL